MFQFPSLASLRDDRMIKPAGFPHSDISGSKPVQRLTEAFRSYTTSFIASWRLGIHRKPYIA